MADEGADKLNEIAAQVRTCILCDLHKTRTKAVPGDGNFHAEILFIGEGPGFHEDKQGLPFVGRSGDYLEQLLKLLDLPREQVFITNVVKCRPPENRDPLPIEMGTCKPYLDSQIELIDPLVIVTLGRFSMARYFPKGKITQIHGQPKFEGRYAYVPLFHPAAVLRNPALEPEMEADFRRIPQVLEQVRTNRSTLPAAPMPSASEPPDGTPVGGATPVGGSAADDGQAPKQLSLF